MGILYYIENKKLKKEKFTSKKTKEFIKKKIFFWVDINTTESKTIQEIGRTLNLHSLTIEDIERKNAMPKVEDFKDYILIVMYGINKEMKNYEVDFVLGDTFLLSAHSKGKNAEERIINKTEKITYLLNKGPEFLLHELISLELENYLPLIEQIDKKREEYEKIILKNANTKKLSEIIADKEKINKIKRSSLIFMEKILLLSRLDSYLISKKAQPFYRDLYDTSARINDELDSDMEGLRGLIDLHMSVLSNKMNEIMKVLSVIATVMLPLSVITGIYGMNFKFLPISEWEFGFWFIIFLMVGLMFTMLFFFKKRQWF